MKILYPYVVNRTSTKGPGVVIRNMYEMMNRIRGLEVVNPSMMPLEKHFKMKRFVYSVLGKIPSYYPFLSRKLNTEYDFIFFYQTGFYGFDEENRIIYLHNEPFVHINYLPIETYFSYHGVHNIVARVFDKIRMNSIRDDDIVFVNSMFTKKRHGNETFNVLYPPIDVKNFRYLRRTHTDKLRLIIISNLEPIKGVSNFIIGMTRYLRDNERNIHVDIYGDGIEKKKIVRLIIKRKLSNVKFRGVLTEHNKRQILTTYDALIIPSFCETSGIVKYESFASGVPVIGRDSCATREFITKDTGAIFDTYELLSDIFDYFVENRKDIQKMRKKCRDISWRFDYSTASKIFKKVLGR